MPSPARGQGRMSGRGRGRGGSRSANTSDNEGKAPARVAARDLKAALDQSATPTGPRGRNARSRGNSPRPNGVPFAAPRQVTAPSNATASNQADRFRKLKDLREQERKAAIAQGILVDPDRPRSLDDAVTPVGTCPDMCPEYERLLRIQQKDYFLQELDPATVGLDRSQHRVDESRMVKAFKRSAAGTDEQLPSDLRPPHVLKETCKYLFNSLLSEENQSIESAYGFIWDRSRAIRNDFSIQQLNKLSEIRVAIECLEWIARFHILTLHQIGGLPKDQRPERYDYYQDLEQLDKTLLSLINYYQNVRNFFRSPNEAEFRAYRIVYQITSPTPNVEDAVQLWPTDLIRDHRVQRALKLYNAAQSIRQEQGPLVPRIGHPVAQGDWDRFFKLVKSKQTSFLMSCVAEIYFNFVRHRAIRAIWRAYRTGGEGRASDGWSLAELAQALGFDNEERVRDFVENYRFKVVEKDDGKLYLDVNSAGKSFPSPLQDKQEPQLSATVVEPKRRDRTASAIINGLTVKAAIEAGQIASLDREQHTEYGGAALLPVEDTSTPLTNGFAVNTALQSSGISHSTPTPFAHTFGQSTPAAAITAGSQQTPKFDFPFSFPSPNNSQPAKRKPNRDGDSLFVTGESDEEEGAETTQSEKPHSAQAPPSLNPSATAFAPSPSSPFTSASIAPISNFSSASNPTSTFVSAQTIQPPSRPTFDFSVASPTIGTIGGASTIAKSSAIAPSIPTTTIDEWTIASAANSPTFGARISTSFPSQPTSPSQPTFPFEPTSEMGRPNLEKIAAKAAALKAKMAAEKAQQLAPANQPAQTQYAANPFGTPSSSSVFAHPSIPTTPASATAVEIPGLTKDNSPTTNLLVPGTSTTASPAGSAQSQPSTSHPDPVQNVKEQCLQELAGNLTNFEPSAVAGLVDRTKTLIDQDLAKAYFEAHQHVERLEAMVLAAEPFEKKYLSERLLGAIACRTVREAKIKKIFSAVVKDQQRQQKKAAEAEREKSLEHYTKVRTAEVKQYLTRQVAFHPRDPVIGAIPGFFMAKCFEILDEEIDNYDKELEEKRLEAEREEALEAERLNKAPKETKKKEEAVSTRRKLQDAVKRKEKERKMNAVLEEARNSSSGVTAALWAQLEDQRQREEMEKEGRGEERETTRATTRKNMQEAIKRKELEKQKAKEVAKLSMTSEEEFFDGYDKIPPRHPLSKSAPNLATSRSSSGFKNPYFRFKAAGVPTAQRGLKRKLRESPDVPESASKAARHSTSSMPEHASTAPEATVDLIATMRVVGQELDEITTWLKDIRERMGAAV